MAVRFPSSRAARKRWRRGITAGIAELGRFWTVIACRMLLLPLTGATAAACSLRILRAAHVYHGWLPTVPLILPVAAVTAAVAMVVVLVAPFAPYQEPEEPTMPKPDDGGVVPNVTFMGEPVTRRPWMTPGWYATGYGFYAWGNDRFRAEVSHTGLRHNPDGTVTTVRAYTAKILERDEAAPDLERCVAERDVGEGIQQRTPAIIWAQRQLRALGAGEPHKPTNQPFEMVWCHRGPDPHTGLASISQTHRTGINNDK